MADKNKPQEDEYVSVTDERTGESKAFPAEPSWFQRHVKEQFEAHGTQSNLERARRARDLMKKSY